MNEDSDYYGDYRDEYDNLTDFEVNGHVYHERETFGIDKTCTRQLYVIKLRKRDRRLYNHETGHIEMKNMLYDKFVKIYLEHSHVLVEIVFYSKYFPKYLQRPNIFELIVMRGILNIVQFFCTNC